MRRIRDPALLEWLADRSKHDGCAAGYDADGWEAATWILNAMYENPELPVDVSYDEVDRFERARGLSAIESSEEPETAKLIAESTLTGSGIGRSRWPGPGWRRLRWDSLGRRLGVDPLAPRPRYVWIFERKSTFLPASWCFPYSSWPVSIAPPAEGSLDREQFLRLLDHVCAATLGGPKAECLAFYGFAASLDFEEWVIYGGRLGELAGLYDHDHHWGSPSNLWPLDRSWLVYTDWDLLGTKVSGSASLVARLDADEELETRPVEPPRPQNPSARARRRGLIPRRTAAKGKP